MRYPHIPWLPLLFYPALPVAAAAGLLLWQDWPPALALIVPYVPWVMALIGIAICLMYQRSQTMALMLSVLVAAAAWPALAEQAPWALGPALAWWALAYTINALWAERSSVLLDLTARLGLMAWRAAIALAGKEGTADFFSTLAVQGALARLGVPVEALAALLATGLTLTLLLLRYGRPQQAGQWLGFVCMAWALPRGAQHPIELALMSAAALTSLSISLAHEGFHMAFRDELTGLPGRRALNESCNAWAGSIRWRWRTWIISRPSTIPMATTWATRCCAWSRRNCAACPAAAMPTAMAARSSRWCFPARPRRKACRTWKPCGAPSRPTRCACATSRPVLGRTRRACAAVAPAADATRGRCA